MLTKYLGRLIRRCRYPTRQRRHRQQRPEQASGSQHEQVGSSPHKQISASPHESIALDPSSQRGEHEQQGCEQPHGSLQTAGEVSSDSIVLASGAPQSADSGEIKDTWAAVLGKKPPTYAMSYSITTAALTAEAERFGRHVLEPLGISVVREGGPLTGRPDARFQSGARHAADCAALDCLWISAESVSLFVANYQHLESIKATASMHLANMQHFLLRYPVLTTTPSSAEGSCLAQRWLHRPMSFGVFWHFPPILAPGYDASVAATLYPPTPSLSYLLSFLDRSSSDAQTLKCVASIGDSAADNTFAAYLTVELYHQHPEWNEVDRMALIGSTVLYNRFRLREKALEKKGISIYEEHALEDVWHFGITLSPRGWFDVWSFEPHYLPPPEATPTDAPSSSSVAREASSAPRLATSSAQDRPAQASALLRGGPRGSTTRKTPGQSTRTGNPLPPDAMPQLAPVPQPAACHASAWKGCRVNSVFSGSFLQKSDVDRLASYINDIHRWALDSHAAAVVRDAALCAGLHPPAGGSVQDESMMNVWASG